MQEKQQRTMNKSTIRCQKQTDPVAAHVMEINHPVYSIKYTKIEKICLATTGEDVETLLLMKEAF